MNSISITNGTTSVPLDQTFSIFIAEPPCPNCTWQIDIPYGLTLVNVRKSSNYEGPGTEWTLKGTHVGTYTLQFLYRRQCCGRPTLKHQTYTITIY